MDKEIKISFPIKHSDNVEENLNNLIILKLQDLLAVSSIEVQKDKMPFKIRVKIQNRIIDELISCLEQKRMVVFPNE